MSSYNCWEVSDAVMGVSRRVLMYGPPGTGKTYAAIHRAVPDGKKVYSITMTEETPMAEIRGHFVQKDGSFVWMDGPAVRAWKENARLVINEIDRASDDVLSFLYAIMDDPDFAEVTLPTGETISPGDEFQLVATMNGEPDDLPDALQDRLPVAIKITDLNPEALERLPEDLRDPAHNTTLLENRARSLSIRAWLEFATLRERLTDKMGDEGVKMAAQAVFGDKGHDALLALQVASEASEAFVAQELPASHAEEARLIAQQIEAIRKAEGLEIPEGPINSTVEGDGYKIYDIIRRITHEAEIMFGHNIQFEMNKLVRGREDKQEMIYRYLDETGLRTYWFYTDGSMV